MLVVAKTVFANVVRVLETVSTYITATERYRQIVKSGQVPSSVADFKIVCTTDRCLSNQSKEREGDTFSHIIIIT